MPTLIEYRNTFSNYWESDYVLIAIEGYTEAEKAYLHKSKDKNQSHPIKWLKGDDYWILDQVTHWMPLPELPGDR